MLRREVSGPGKKIVPGEGRRRVRATCGQTTGCLGNHQWLLSWKQCAGSGEYEAANSRAAAVSRNRKH